MKIDLIIQIAGLIVNTLILLIEVYKTFADPKEKDRTPDQG